MVVNEINSSFPSQIVSNDEKASYEYGLAVARAIEREWFSSGRQTGAFYTNVYEFHRRRLYARGEQSVQKYKDELSVNGDLSYLNLDWKPVPIIPKFVDIVVNGIASRGYDVKTFAQDPASRKRKTKFADNLMIDMQNKDLLNQLSKLSGLNYFSIDDPNRLPANEEELEVYMQLNYKESIEIAVEELISEVLERNRYKETYKRVVNDLVILGMGAVKTEFNKADGIRVRYVDPATIVFSYTEDPTFSDIYYVGEVKTISLQELAKQFPHLTEEQLKDIRKHPAISNYTLNYNAKNDYNSVDVLYFEYRTFANQVFKIKKTDTGLEKAIEKTDTFDPPENDNFEKVGRKIEVLYTGAKILGYNKMLEWKLADNMTRPTSNSPKVNMNYSIVAPRMYKGRVESLVSRITGFADMIQLTHLKLQQVMSRIVPDGIYIDVDGLNEVDLGNGTLYNPAEAINMYFQTGSIVGRSFTQDGDMNPGKVPIQEIQTSNGQAKIQSLINTYQYYLQMIRDATGLNEARDGSMPDPDSLVGLQKLAAANSNTATRHILQSAVFATRRMCENIVLRAQDALEFPLTAEALIDSINLFNVSTLEELKGMQLHDFGIYVHVEPDEDEKAILETNIQIALKTGQIYLEDAIDIRNIKNIDLANKTLKIRRQKKQQQEQQAQQANIQAQAQANAETAEKAAMAEAQKQQVMTAQKLELEKGIAGFEIQKLEKEAELKMRLMELEFQFNSKLAEIQANARKNSESYKEDRKDERTKIQASQQSDLIDQRKNGTPPKQFESSGYDVLNGFDLSQYEPT